MIKFLSKLCLGGEAKEDVAESDVVSDHENSKKTKISYSWS